MKHLNLLVITLLLFNACDEKDFDNNYDPETQELSPPWSLNITQNEDGVYLEWRYSESNIDSYLIEKQEENSSWNKLTEIANYNTKDYTDSNIEPGVTYNYRISIKAGQNQSDYATGSITTIIDPPIISIENITPLNGTSATCNIKIENNSMTIVSTRGVCWSTSYEPVIEDNKIDAGNGTGIFECDINGLTLHKNYYIRAYATNSKGTYYSNEISYFTIQGPDITGQTGTITDIDGNSYKWVGIADMAWMAENLRTTHYPNGEEIPLVISNSDWQNLGDNDDAYCFYDNNEATYAQSYGALYTYAAAKDACPEGWHLSTWDEWDGLSEFLISINWENRNLEGVFFKSTTGWNSGGNGNDSYGFKALPGGYRYAPDGAFYRAGGDGWWWQSSSVIGMQKFFDGFGYQFWEKPAGVSVRCLRD